MKKRNLVVATLTLSFLMATTVFARPLNNNYSMMNRYNSDYGMTQEQYDAMNEFMEENYGYTMNDVAGSRCNMTKEQFDAMNEYMEENYGYSMNSRTFNETPTGSSNGRRSCH